MEGETHRKRNKKHGDGSKVSSQYRQQRSKGGVLLLGVEVPKATSAKWQSKLNEYAKNGVSSDWRFVVVGELLTIGNWKPEDGLDLYPAGSKYVSENSECDTWTARKEVSISELTQINEEYHSTCQDQIYNAPSKSSGVYQFEMKLAWTDGIEYRPCPSIKYDNHMTHSTHRSLAIRNWCWEQLPGGSTINRVITVPKRMSCPAIFVLCRLGSRNVVQVPINMGLSISSPLPASPILPAETTPESVMMHRDLHNSKKNEDIVAAHDKIIIALRQEVMQLRSDVAKLQKQRQKDNEMLCSFHKTVEQIGEALRWAYKQMDVSERRYDEARYQATEALCEVVKLQAVAYASHTSPPTSPTGAPLNYMNPQHNDMSRREDGSDAMRLKSQNVIVPTTARNVLTARNRPHWAITDNKIGIGARDSSVLSGVMRVPHLNGQYPPHLNTVGGQNVMPGWMSARPFREACVASVGEGMVLDNEAEPLRRTSVNVSNLRRDSIGTKTNQAIPVGDYRRESVDFEVSNGPAVNGSPSQVINTSRLQNTTNVATRQTGGARVAPAVSIEGCDQKTRRPSFVPPLNMNALQTSQNGVKREAAIGTLGAPRGDSIGASTDGRKNAHQMCESVKIQNKSTMQVSPVVHTVHENFQQGDANKLRRDSTLPVHLYWAMKNNEEAVNAE